MLGIIAKKQKRTDDRQSFFVPEAGIEPARP